MGAGIRLDAPGAAPPHGAGGPSKTCRERLSMKVSDFMNPEPITVLETATLAVVLKLMADQKNRHVVVLRGQQGVAGIISDRDLAMFYDPVKMTPEKWGTTTAAQLMSPDPITIGSHASIEEAAKLLLKSGVSALPIVENGALRGILSEKDFVRHFAASGE